MKNPSKIFDLHEQGLTPSEIAELTGLNRKSVVIMLNRKGLFVNRHTKIEFPNELIQFIRGSILGDGCIPFKKGRQCHIISFGHCVKQLEYIQWKHDFLKKYNLVTSKVKPYIQKSDRYINGECKSYSFTSLTNPIFSEFRKLYYREDKKKYINREDIIKLDEFGLAIWYMDDGNVWNVNKERNGSSCITLNTNSFSKDDVLFLIDFLMNKWNIKSTYNKSDNTIRISVFSCENFIELVRPYIVKCMEYKMVLYKSDELLGLHHKIGQSAAKINLC